MRFRVWFILGRVRRREAAPVSEKKGNMETRSLRRMSPGARIASARRVPEFNKATSASTDLRMRSAIMLPTVWMRGSRGVGGREVI